MREERGVGSADVRIRRARAREAERLREIAAASKSHWGYEPDLVRQWAETLDLSPEQLRSAEVYVADVAGRAIAWSALVRTGDVVWLDHLWVEPGRIGAGVGSRLFGHATERARQLGGRRLEWEAEPNAVGFYERMGARYLRESEPSEWGRVLPVMGVDLDDATVG